MEAPLFLGKDIAQGARSHYKFPELKVDEMEREEQGGAVIALGSKLAERVDACDTLLATPAVSFLDVIVGALSCIYTTNMTSVHAVDSRRSYFTYVNGSADKMDCEAAAGQQENGGTINGQAE